MSVERPRYVLDVRHQPQLLTIKRREYIPQQQQLGQIIITFLCISTLGLHSQACQSVYRLGNYWFHDTKLVEGFLGDGHMRRRCTDQPIQPPCVYNSTTIAVQQYTRKKQEQKSRDRGIWTNILGVSRTKKQKKNSRDTAAYSWRSACPESSALPLSQKEM